MTWYASKSDGSGGAICGCGCPLVDKLQVVFAGCVPCPLDCTLAQGVDNSWLQIVSGFPDGLYELDVVEGFPAIWRDTEIDFFTYNQFSTDDCSGDPLMVSADMLIAVACLNGKFLLQVSGTKGDTTYYILYNTDYEIELGVEFPLPGLCGGTVTISKAP